MVNLLLDNKLSLTIDIADTSEVDGSVELSINANFLYNTCNCNYNDRLWFDEDTIKKFIKDLSIEKDCSLTDIDSDFAFEIISDKLKIEIHKKDFYAKDNLNICFEMPFNRDFTRVKNAFEELYL